MIQPLLQTSQNVGRHEILGILGHGANGIVYLASDTYLRRTVALKVVEPSTTDLDRVLDEARVMDKLNHPHIVDVLGVDLISGKVAIAMEYVQGQNLQGLLSQVKTLPMGQAVDITCEILDALEYAHAHHVVHRDVKPANVLISVDGTAKLTDFGLAQVLGTNSFAAGAGTYAYMAPEDFAEDRQSDSRSDIWSVAVTLFEMITGSRPFTVQQSGNPFAWRDALVRQKCPLLADTLSEPVPPGLEAAVARGLMLDPSARYGTAGEFKDDLLAVRGECGDAPALLPDATTPVGFGLYGLQAAGNFGSQTAATVPATPPSATSSRWPWQRTAVVRPPVATVRPSQLEFPPVRLGESVNRTLTIVQLNGELLPSGEILEAPSWMRVDPVRFTNRRQKLTVQLVSGGETEPTALTGRLRIATHAGEVIVPVTGTVRAKSRSFAEVALWYSLMLAAVVSPAAVVVSTSLSARGSTPGIFGPATTFLLAIMGMIVAIGARLGWIERTLPLLIAGFMALDLGVALSPAHRNYTFFNLIPLGMALFCAVLILIIQTATRTKWKVWVAIVLACGYIATVQSVSRSSAVAGNKAAKSARHHPARRM